MATITKVEFYSGTTKIGEDLTSPYTLNWSTGAVGAHALKAKAILSDNTVVESPIVNITINAAVAGFSAETTAYMNQIAIANDSTLVYAGTAYETTGAALWTAVEAAVSGLKTNGLYTKMHYFRPRIGGTAVKHAVNLINPTSVLGTYTNAWTHSGAGSQATATNSLFDTGFNPSTSQTAGNSGLTVSVITDENTLDNSPIIGAYTADGDNAVIYAIKLTASNYMRVRYNAGVVAFSPADPVGKTGPMTVSRVGGSTNFRFFRKGAFIHEGAGTGTNPDKNLYEATINGLSVTSWAGTFGVTAAHTGLTDTEAANLHTIISDLELALKRKTW